jgi:hypothetical protein
MGCKCFCGREVLARGLCSTHYKYWRFENVPGAREKHLLDQRTARTKKRKAGLVKDDRYKSREYRRRHYEKSFARCADWYVRKTCRLPKDVPKAVLDVVRTRLLLKRMLKGRL